RLSQDKAATLLGIVRRYATGSPASDEEVQAWTTRSRKLLREKFGADAERRLQTVQEFVKARPFLKQYLDETGAGASPEWVMMLAANAHNLRMTPRKKEGA